MILKDLLQDLRSIDDIKTIAKIRTLFRKRLVQFSKAVWSQSPYIDPVNKKIPGSGTRLGVFPKKLKTITIYGRKPNIARVKSFSAPTDSYTQGRARRAFYGGKWHSLTKNLDMSSSAGVDGGDRSAYAGSFFGHKKDGITMGYQLIAPGLIHRAYADESTLDWMLKTHKDEVLSLFGECIAEVLAKQRSKS